MTIFYWFFRSIRKWIASQKRGNNRRRSTQPTPNPHQVDRFCLFKIICTYVFCLFSATNFFLLFLSINNIPRRKSSQFRTIQYLLTLRPLCPRHGWIFISRKRICIKLLTKAWNDDCSGVPDTYLKATKIKLLFPSHT